MSIIYVNFTVVSDISNELLTENIPCRSTKAAEALKRIKEEGKYKFNALPATDIKGNPILPGDYERKLSGATALIRVTMTADYFSKRGTQFYADIYSITVLSPPIPRIVSPSKKRKFEVPDFVK